MIIKANIRLNQLNFDAEATRVISFHYTYDLVDEGQKITDYSETFGVEIEIGEEMFKMIVNELVQQLLVDIKNDDLQKYQEPPVVPVSE